METAERIREMVSQIVVTSPAGEFGFTVSIGAASFAVDDKDWSAVVNRADQAMYQAKAMGRNRVMASDVEQVAH